MKMKSLLTTLVILMSAVAPGLAGGYANFHCPSGGNSTLVIGCELDCREQHGAETGICGDVSNGDHHCYCQGRTVVYKRSNLQCKEISDGFRNLCTHDCVCNHGADGGHCSWDQGVCYCENWGRNQNNLGCPAQSGEEWLKIAGQLAKQK